MTVYTSLATDNLALNWPAVPCCSPKSDCRCGVTERVLRWIANGRVLSKDQREWCLNQIGQVEGWDRKEYEDSADHEIARAVLTAWKDAAYDSGMI